MLEDEYEVNSNDLLLSVFTELCLLLKPESAFQAFRKCFLPFLIKAPPKSLFLRLLPALLSYCCPNPAASNSALVTGSQPSQLICISD